MDEDKREAHNSRVRAEQAERQVADLTERVANLRMVAESAHARVKELEAEVKVLVRAVIEAGNAIDLAERVLRGVAP